MNYSRLVNVFVLLIILLSGAVLSNDLIEPIRIASLLVVLGIIIGFSSRSFNVRDVAIPILFLLTFFVHSLLRVDSDLYLKYAIFAFTLSFAAIYIPFRSFSLTFVNITFFLSAVSLIFFVVLFFFPELRSYFLSTSNGTREFFHLFLYSFYKHSDPSVISYRNASIFVEPGMFACMIVLALIFDSVNGFILSTRKRVILYIAGLTTFSAVIFLFLLSRIFFLSFSLQRRLLLGPSIFSFIILVLSIYLLIPRFSLLNISSFQRMESMIIDFSIFLSSPFFGVGHSEYYSLVPLIDSNFDFAGSVSPLMNALSIYGLSLFLLLCFSVVRLIISFSISFRFRLFCFFNIFVILMTQPLVLSPIFFFLYNCKLESRAGRK